MPRSASSRRVSSLDVANKIACQRSRGTAIPAVFADAEIAEAMGMTRERVTELITASYRPASLDAPIGEDGETQLQDVVKDENIQTAYEEFESQTRYDLIRELIDHLDERELTIIRYRFGLDGGPERTLEEVGAKFGVTRERIRQIQNSALSKLRKMMEKRDAIRDPELDAFCPGLVGSD